MIDFYRVQARQPSGEENVQGEYWQQADSNDSLAIQQPTLEKVQ